MKTLRLVCSCGAAQMFRGTTVEDIIAAIDTSGWSDRAGTAGSKQRAKGEAEGRCERCCAKDWIRREYAR